MRIEVIEGDKKNMVKIIHAQDKELEAHKTQICFLKDRLEELYRNSLADDKSKILSFDHNKNAKSTRKHANKRKLRLESFDADFGPQ